MFNPKANYRVMRNDPSLIELNMQRIVKVYLLTRYDCNNTIEITFMDKSSITINFVDKEEAQKYYKMLSEKLKLVKEHYNGE